MGAGTSGSPQAEDRGQWDKGFFVLCIGALGSLIKETENTQWDQEAVVPSAVQSQNKTAVLATVIQGTK